MYNANHNVFAHHNVTVVF